MANRPLYGLVLAGGMSRRMGRDKALLQRDGKSQLEHIVDLLGDHVDVVHVSARPDQKSDPERSRFALLFDDYENMGPIAGILSALEQHPQADWLVVACDLPNIDGETLQYLLQHRSEQQPFTAFRSSYDDLPEPLCAIYTSGSDAILREFVEAGTVCPRKVLIQSDTCLLVQPSPGALDNVNTPDDLQNSVLGAAS